MGSADRVSSQAVEPWATPGIAGASWDLDPAPRPLPGCSSALLGASQYLCLVPSPSPRPVQAGAPPECHGSFHTPTCHRLQQEATKKVNKRNTSN